MVDTNVLISAAIIDKSKTARLVKDLSSQYVFAQSFETWKEFSEKIFLKKFDKYIDDRKRIGFMTFIARSSNFFDVTEKIDI